MTSTEDYFLYKLEEIFLRRYSATISISIYFVTHLVESQSENAITFNSHVAVTNVLEIRNQLRVGSAMWVMKFLARFLFLGLNSVLQCKTKSPH